MLSSEKFSWIPFTEDKLSQICEKREGEQRLGKDLLFQSNPKYVIIGVCESVGPVANGGRKGAEKAFLPALKKLLNMQSNRFLNFKNVKIAGHIHCNYVQADVRAQTSELDKYLHEVLRNEVPSDAIPIVVGGGHNNAYSLIHFSFERFGKVDVVNLDLHADYRRLEGRHSGNSFSYAFKDGFLEKYFVLGLSKRYNSENMLNQLTSDGHFFTFQEDYLDATRILEADIDKVSNGLNPKRFGLELDLDSIENMPSSAQTSSAFSMNEARIYIQKLAQNKSVCYLHLPEGAIFKNEDENIVGKAIAHLITDFLEYHQ